MPSACGASVPARKAAEKIRVRIRKYGFIVRSNITPRFNLSIATKWEKCFSRYHFQSKPMPISGW